MCGQTPSRKKLVTGFNCWSEPMEKAGIVPTCSFRIPGGSQPATRYRLIGSQTLMQWLKKYADLFEAKIGRQLFLPLCSVLTGDRIEEDQGLSSGFILLVQAQI